MSWKGGKGAEKKTKIQGQICYQKKCKSKIKKWNGKFKTTTQKVECEVRNFTLHLIQKFLKQRKLTKTKGVPSVQITTLLPNVL